MKARAVIGALYGDEGKGLTSCFLAHQAMEEHGACTVVRSNGGAQAAHTVELPDGTRHVFHHFGSGTFSGAKTHLSRFMIINPIMFNREWDDLVALGYTPEVTVASTAILTLPQDMMINQMLETMRGNARHGSCGLGIGETMERVEKQRYQPVLQDFRGGNTVARSFEFSDIIPSIRQRLDDLGIEYAKLPPEYGQHLFSFDIYSKFVEDCQLMLSRCTIVEEEDINQGQPIVFEGAQGLALDRDMGFFPYVTRSKTGLVNIVKLCREMGIDDLEAIYVMRTYTSRHGAGPLDGETRHLITDYGFKIEDRTNAPNDWQGTLRFAPLDVWLAERMISLDNASADLRGINLSRGMMITCMDQAPEIIPVFSTSRKYFDCEKDRLPGYIASVIGATKVWTSNGPTRETITPHS